MKLTPKQRKRAQKKFRRDVKRSDAEVKAVIAATIAERDERIKASK